MIARIGTVAAVAATSALAAVLMETPAPAAEWRAEALLGAPWNAPLPLVIRQESESELRVRPTWDTAAFRFPLYYAVGIGRERWSITLVHHKLHLVNRPAEVEEFAISHGYNLVVLGHRWTGRSRPRLGAGPVIAHPENTVRGRAGPDGYRLSGVVIEASARHELGRGRWRAVAELAASVAWARVPVAGGDADVPNLAVHLRFGPGFVSSDGP